MSDTLRESFIQNFNLPIPVTKSPHFEYFLALYEPLLQSQTKWQNLQLIVNESFHGKDAAFSNYFNYFLKQVVKAVEDTTEYKTFSKDTSMFGGKHD